MQFIRFVGSSVLTKTATHTHMGFEWTLTLIILKTINTIAYKSHSTLFHYSTYHRIYCYHSILMFVCRWWWWWWWWWWWLWWWWWWSVYKQSKRLDLKPPDRKTGNGPSAPNHVLFSRQMPVDSHWTQTQPTDVSLCLRTSGRWRGLKRISLILTTQRDLTPRSPGVV